MGEPVSGWWRRNAVALGALVVLVPARIVDAWVVPADAFAAGDEVPVTLYARSVYTGSFVTTGQWWSDPVRDAMVTVEIEDVGAGVDAEDADGQG